ncbi:VOC family protein [Streptomyces cucumeris]|uniref:VOC family protein n=1 Tax=Streptomyces cucumeris TaxID=2962890 RepID=UPI0020C91455|nr:VOC family protein [Streptomyces sp. NEAU-Y11]MCP9210150.1 VOC family protein [Streptomyces sp. NEAU-Y11]
MLTTDYVPGAPNWLDLGAPDTDAAVAFYQGLLGWSFESAGPEAGGYGFFTRDRKTVAALGPLTEQNARSAWTPYFHTPDADATAASVEMAGGAVVVAPFDVFHEGRMAHFADPGGARFAVWQPGKTAGLELVNDPGSLCWTELHSPDPVVALAFYHAVFGWDAEDVSFPGGTYTVLSTSGAGKDGAFGGVAKLQEGHSTPAQWLPYIQVTDCDGVVTKGQELGGSVLMPAFSAEGVGRMAWLTDVAGAPFGVLTSEGEDGGG